MTQPRDQAPVAPPAVDRRAYVRPALIDLGELRDITLGASPGIGDSGGAGGFKCPGCP